MTITRKSIVLLTMFSAVILLTTVGCKKDDPEKQKTTYNLKAKDILGVTGTVTFTETSSTVTTVIIALVNAPAGIHPANIYMNSVVENGAVSIPLNPVDANGNSSTEVTAKTFAELIAYTGSIKIVKSSIEYDVIVAQCDIGGNVITTTSKSYPLATVGAFGVSGTALFEKRVNGNTLVTISLTGTIDGDEYPATINLGSVATTGGGTPVKILNNVDGTTGKGYTNIQKLDSGVDITYDNWMVYDGYINVYQTSIGLNNIICQGDIGSN